jgi:hypothetical protein
MAVGKPTRNHADDIATCEDRVDFLPFVSVIMHIRQNQILEQTETNVKYSVH